MLEWCIFQLLECHNIDRDPHVFCEATNTHVHVHIELCYVCKSTFDDSITMPGAVTEVKSQLSVDMN